MKTQIKGKYKSMILEWLTNFIRFRLTPVGRYVIASGFFLILMSNVVVNADFLLYSTMFFFVLIFLLTPLYSWLSLPRLITRIKTPARTSAGATIIEEISVKNPDIRDGYLVTIRQDRLPVPVIPAYQFGILVPFLKKGEEVTIKLPLLFKRRGDFNLDFIRIESSFPLGVFNWGYLQKNSRNILVYPFFKPLLHCRIPAGRKLQPGGIALASHIGESTEFMGTREFRDGDDPRFIHWKSWARLNKLIIKEFQEEYFTRIAIFIDTYVPLDSPEEDYEAMESLLSLSASISDYLERQEYIIDILAAGPQIFYLQAGRSLAYLDQILDILACLGQCWEKPYSKLTPHLMDELGKISTVVVLLLGWDEERRDFLRGIKEMGVEMRIFLVANRKEKIDMSLMDESLGEWTFLDTQQINQGVDQL